MFDKSLDENEVALQEFVINGFDRTKLAYMIYGVNRNKGEGIGYSQDSFNQRVNTLVKPMKPSCSSFAKKGYTPTLY